MPILDWTRTRLDLVMDDGSLALEFNASELRVFDLCILKREGAEKDYTDKEISDAKLQFKNMSKSDIQRISDNILKGLPGSEDLRYARLVADHLGTDHHEVVVTEKQMLQFIEKDIYQILTGHPYLVLLLWSIFFFNLKFGNFCV